MSKSYKPSYRPSGNCPKCGAFRQRLQKDHIVPRWKARMCGWSSDQYNAPDNIQLLCANCHEDKTLAETTERGQTEEANEKRRQANLKRFTSAESRETLGAQVKQAYQENPDRWKNRRNYRDAAWRQSHSEKLRAAWRDGKFASRSHRTINNQNKESIQ